MIQGKVWGYTQEIIKGSSFEVHRIEIDKGGYCSMHKHLHKNNMFFVEKGFIRVEVKKNDYDLTDKTNLEAGEMMIVKAGEFHRFRAAMDSVVFEIYWLDDIKEDIVRQKVGGKKKNK